MTKVGDCLFWFTVGITVGAVGTVFHQTYKHGFPIGLGLSLSMVLISSAIARPERRRIWSFTVGLSALLLVASANSASDVMLPLNFASVVWAFSSIGITLLFSMVPRLPQRT